MSVKSMSKEELSLYRRWAAMKARCNPNIKHNECHRRNYADKGIRVCPEWQEWSNFRDWAYDNGYRIDLTLDRKDGDDDYYPDNCRWVDNIIQANNISETVLKERAIRKELNKNKPRKRYLSKRQKEVEAYRLWYANFSKKDISEIPKGCLTRKHMKILIEAGIYEPELNPYCQ